MGFPGGSDGKEAICSVGDLGLLPGLGRSPGGGHGNPLQCSCLGNPHGQRSLVGCSPWGHKESDMTEHLSTEKYENLLNMRIWEIWEYCWLKEGSAYPTELLLNFYEVGAEAQMCPSGRCMPLYRKMHASLKTFLLTTALSVTDSGCRFFYLGCCLLLSWCSNLVQIPALLLTVWLWVGYLTSLSFCFLTYKMEILIVPTTSGRCGDWRR